MTLQRIALLAAFVSAISVGTANAQMRITEWMYSGSEFIEFTNVGTSSVDMTGWSYDDDSEIPGTVDLSTFGIVAAGESVILSEDDEATFRSDWGLGSTVKIIGSNAANLGRADEINLYDASTALVDRLTYGDEDFVGSIRTRDASGNPITAATLGANDVYQWQLAYVGDSFGTYTSSVSGVLGNPGSYISIPEPGSIVLLILGVAGVIACRRR